MSETTIDLSKLSAKELKLLAAQAAKAERDAADKEMRDYVRDRDRFISTTVAEMEAISEELTTLKKRTVATGNELHERAYLIKGVEPRPLKSFQLINTDGDLKLELASADKLELNETAEVHINGIKDLLREKYAERNKSMYRVIDTILSANAKGDYDEKLVLKLSKLESEINEERFSAHLEALRMAFYATGSATYARAYRLNRDSGKWEVINMQFSSI